MSCLGNRGRCCFALEVSLLVLSPLIGGGLALRGRLSLYLRMRNVIGSNADWVKNQSGFCLLAAAHESMLHHPGYRSSSADCQHGWLCSA